MADIEISALPLPLEQRLPTFSDLQTTSSTF